MRKIKRPGVLAALLGMGGCSTAAYQAYDGPPQPDEETAFIAVQETSGDRTRASVSILSVDTPLGEMMRVSARSVRVLPRQVCVNAFARTSTLDSLRGELCFEAEAGGRYEIIPEVMGSRNPPQLMSTSDSVDATVSDPQSGPYFVERILVVETSTQRIVAAVSR